MKRTGILIVLLAGMCVAAGMARAQEGPQDDSTGVPGDNFSLHGALAMFQRAASPEEFETLINTKDNGVNNLDLNGDNEVDYIRVIDRMEGSAHAFVLQVPVSKDESHDIAVIELEKAGNDSAIVQIVGDEDVFGEQIIVEPEAGEDDSDEDEDQGGKGSLQPSRVAAPPPYVAVVVNVWAWPSVRYVYAPGYTAWVSPWRWTLYPAWWRPWRPLSWHVYHPFRVRYHAGYTVVHTHRVMHAHRVYAPRRVASVTVRTRHHATINHYRVTRATTIKTRPGGTTVKTRTARTVTKPGGTKVKTSTTRTKKEAGGTKTVRTKKTTTKVQKKKP